MGLSQRLYIERVKKALFKNLDNRIPAMRVRSRPDERRGKSAMTNSQTACADSERSILTGKRMGHPFRQDSGRGNNDTHHRLPARQTGWPTPSCNQQAPRNANERLVVRKPARMVPTAPGASCKLAQSDHLFHSDCRNKLLTANPCGANICAAPVCRQPTGVSTKS